MSILCATSYFNGIQDIPDIIKKLDTLLIVKSEKGFGIRDIDLAEHINNLIVKNGFMLIGKGHLEKSISGNQAETNFFLSNFIYNSKAFLDAIAIILNHFYQLNLSGGNIDLRKTIFAETLRKNKTEIESEIKKQQKWIDDVVKWRDELIHRSSVASIIYSPPDETGKRPRDNIVKMPIEPYSIYDFIRASSLPHTKKNPVEQDILQFCSDWIMQGEIMFNVVLSFIEKDLRDRLGNSPSET